MEQGKWEECTMKRQLFLTIAGVMIPLILYICCSEGINAYSFTSLQHLNRFDPNGVLLEADGEVDVTDAVLDLKEKKLPYKYTLQNHTDLVFQKEAFYRQKPILLNMEIIGLSGDIEGGTLSYRSSDNLYADRIRFVEKEASRLEGFTECTKSMVSTDFIIPCILEESTSLLLFGDRQPPGSVFSSEGEAGKMTFRVCALIEDLPSAAENNLQLNRSIFMEHGTDPIPVPVRLYIPDCCRSFFPEGLSGTVSTSCFFRFSEEAFAEGASILNRSDFHASYCCLVDYRTLMLQTDAYLHSISMVGIPILVIMVLISGLLIMNTMFFSIQQRTGEIGLRRAVGAGIGHILLQFLLEGLFIGIAGAAGACFLSGILFGLLNIILPWIAGMGVHLTMHLQTVFAVFMLSILQTQIFSLLPAHTAAHMDPSKALVI